MPKIKLSEGLTPISEFRLRTAELVARVKKNRRSLILTQHGRSTAVLEAIQAFEEKTERLELLEVIVGGLRAAEQGEVVSHAKAMAELDRLIDA
jgi:prevent-host-death family protein